MTGSASRRSRVAPFIVMDMLREARARAATGKNVMHLEAGEPRVPLPRAFMDEAQRLLKRPLPGYTDSGGIAPLRQAIAALYERRYGLRIAPRRILITSGSSGALLLAFLAAFDAGDAVALPLPGYPAYRNMLKALGLEAVPMLTQAKDAFKPQPAALDALAAGAKKPQGIVFTNPANPTGGVLDRGAVAELAACCRRLHIRIIADEVYHGIVYEGEAASFLEFDPDAVIVNSFSKYFTLPGWRLGWAVVPDNLVEPFSRLAQNLFVSPPSLAQHAACVLFNEQTEAALRANVRSWDRNRRHLLKELPRAGFHTIFSCDGAFYMYADVAHMTDDSEALCRALLHEEGVALTPGTDFDPLRGHRYVRFSFSTSHDAVRKATAALQARRCAIGASGGGAGARNTSHSTGTAMGRAAATP